MTIFFRPNSSHLRSVEWHLRISPVTPCWFKMHSGDTLKATPPRLFGRPFLMWRAITDQLFLTVSPNNCSVFLKFSYQKSRYLFTHIITWNLKKIITLIIIDSISSFTIFYLIIDEFTWTIIHTMYNVKIANHRINL